MPITLVTAWGEEVCADELGVQMILTRPFNLDRLFEQFTQLLA